MRFTLLRLLVATKVIATSFLVVGVGITLGDVFKQNNRSAGTAVVIAVKRDRTVQPGQSWNSYYQTASCGEVIGVAGGSHGSQALVENARLSQCARNVVFRTRPGAHVTMSKLTIGPVAPATRQGADRVTIKGPMKITGGVACMGDCFNVVIDNVDGGTVTLATFGGRLRTCRRTG